VNTVSALECEWQPLAHRALADALASWRLEQPALRRFTSPQQLLRFLHGAAPAESDAPLLALLSLAPRDGLAGRLLLQAILPALRSQAVRIRCGREEQEELWELLLFFAWEAISCYPAHQRRRRVAGNLVLQVLHRTTRELHRTSDQPAGLWPTRRRGAVGTRPFVSADREALLRVAVARGAIGERDAELILQTRVDGISLRLVSAVQGVGYDALRKRRQRAEQQLRTLTTVDRNVPKTVFLDLTVSRGIFARAGQPATRPRRPGAASDRPLVSRDAA
jgi:DNA-directed RNA polymerase specialized sigma24 family protein